MNEGKQAQRGLVMMTGSASMSVKSQYLSDNAWIHARERLASAERFFDPGTQRHFLALGVAEGWNCLDVGAGGGSVVEWLCRQVGPTGRVVATDIDTRFLDALDIQNLEVRKHNVISDALEEAAFDLVHTRALLFHLAERDIALDRTAKAVKPGGWLMAEEVDHVSRVPDPRMDPVAADLFRKIASVDVQMRASIGDDLYYGRRLYADVRARGFIDVGAEGRLPIGRGGEPFGAAVPGGYCRTSSRPGRLLITTSGCGAWTAPGVLVEPIWDDKCPARRPSQRSDRTASPTQTVATSAPWPARSSHSWLAWQRHRRHRD